MYNVPATSKSPTTTITTVLQPFSQDYLDEPVPGEKFSMQGKINRLTHRPSGWAPLHPD